jgi:lysophospholipase L1-like esterase
MILRKVLSSLLLLSAVAHANDVKPLPTRPDFFRYWGVAFIGDSITWKWPTDAYFPGSSNEGIGGETSCQMQARFAHDVLALHPRVVVILAGTNDIRYYAETSTRCVDEMVEAAQAHGARVIVGELPANTGWSPGTPNSYGQALYGIWNAEIIAGAAEYRYTVVDYFDATGGAHQDKALFEADGTHPNAAGYAVLSATLRPILDKVL